MNRKIIFALLFAVILISGCKQNDVTTGGSSGGSADDTDNLPSVQDSEFTINGIDWKNPQCKMTENECEKRNDEFNSACTRVLYTADAEMLCHLYINERLRVDDPTNVEYANVGRIYKFSPNVQVMPLNDDNFYFFYDTKIKFCCAGALEKLRDKNYDFCKELKLTKLCE